MNIRNLTIGLLAAAAMTSCDGFIYEDQGDCAPRYKVRFSYNRNIKSSEAFASEVHAVTLYLVDEQTGKVVWSKQDDGDHVRSSSYLMDVPAEPGRYHLVAWCGKGVGPDFEVDDTDDAEGLNCHLVHNTYRGSDGDKHVDRPLGGLYHGRTMSQDFPDDEGDHVYDVDLTKNTNEVNLVLQHISGQPVNKNDYRFYITAANHHLDWTNGLSKPDGETITYHAHTVSSGTAGIETPDHTATAVSACVAEFTISRLVKDEECWVCVENVETGKLVCRVPLVQYALLTKGSAGRYFEDQDYLDRQDKYDMVFFLDEGYRWMDAYIYINAWQLVLKGVDL